MAAPAQADDTAAAWSVTPVDAAGAPDGRTRLELELAGGASVEEHVLLTNSSTVAREFRVYGADGFNTAAGGYDLFPAAQPPTDVGSWVSVATPTVTVAPLATAVVALTVSVPATATPGDHPGGLVVSPVQAQVTEAGVVVDTRVAVRLNVRVAGELTPALDVRSVAGSFDGGLVPFSGGPMTVTYEVVNSGNVKVVGVPRLRVTGLFGTELATLDGGETREVLPGDSFTVTSVLDDVAPMGLTTAVVDVEMAAAPGPATEIPLVSSTGRATVLAVPWTGLALVAIVGIVAWLVVRTVRRRRRESAELWDRVVDEARRELTAPPVHGIGAVLAAVLTVGLLAGPAADGDPSFTLTVPGSGAGSVAMPGGAPVLPARRPAAKPSTPAPDPVPAPVETPVDLPASAEADQPDLLWSPDDDWSPAQKAMLGLGAAGALGGLAFAARRISRARSTGGVA